MADELVHYEVRRGIATIPLDSPHNRNALSAQLRRELREHLTAAADDDGVRVVVLTHTGTVFCSGMDLKEAAGASAGDQGVNEFPAILEQLWTSPKPVVAALKGPARAGGVGIVAACDISIAVISVTVLPRLRPRAAHELFLTGETFDAVRAVEIGLLNSAVPADGVDAEVRRYTDMLALGAPDALAATKRMLQQERSTNLGEVFADMLELSARHFGGPEGQEGITAFREKRKPSWVPADN
jgi:methylglutaconyl-CoA hydratase